MKVQTVTVEIHEKRNHPNEYGHYDARVAYTVEIEHDENPAEVVSDFQCLAREQVLNECDHWIAEIERKRKIESSKSSLGWIIDRAADRRLNTTDEAEFSKHIDILPENERAYYVAKLDDAKAAYLKDIRTNLDNLIAAAGRTGKSWNDDRYHFDRLLESLDTDEQQDYRNSMMLALAPKVEVPLAENDEDIAF